jgi:hypothetical protein
VQSLTDVAQEQVVEYAESAPRESPSVLVGNRSVNGESVSLNGKDVEDRQASGSSPTVTYTHLLRMQSKSNEIVRGRTAWKLKGPRHPKVHPASSV